MTLTHEIRVFCPVHEAAFEVGRSAKILCEITGHTLASGFPTSEIWEFCCNCNTFTPSKLDKGEKARKSCFSCNNDISLRYLCSKCSTVSFAAAIKSRGQSFSISDAGIIPKCPGCNSTDKENIVRHKCNEIDAEVLTSVGKCPFCLENTRVDFVLPGSGSNTQTIVCQNCRVVNPAIAAFCGKCRHQLRNTADVVKLGTEESKSQIMGSLCPNCSTPVPPESDFCGECGQGVKRLVVAPPPPPPPPHASGNFESNASLGPKSMGSAVDPPALIKYLKNPVLAVGIPAAALVLFIMAVVVMSPSGGVTGNSNVNANRTVANAMNTAVNAMNAGAANKAVVPSNAAKNAAGQNVVIGRQGTLTTDANLREYAGPDYNKVGTHYRGARVRVLDETAVPNDEGSISTWYRIQVLEYGDSVDPFNQEMGYRKDPGSLDDGWVNSYPYVSENRNSSRKVRRQIIQFD